MRSKIIYVCELPTNPFLRTPRRRVRVARSSACEGGLQRSELLSLDFRDAVVRMATFKKVMKAWRRGQGFVKEKGWGSDFWENVLIFKEMARCIFGRTWGSKRSMSWDGLMMWGEAWFPATTWLGFNCIFASHDFFPNDFRILRLET